MFYLLDLERTIATGNAFFWKAHKRGYTDEITEAGLYDADEAAEIVMDDFNKRTVMIDTKVVNEIIKQYF
jgi:hypothetical protein